MKNDNGHISKECDGFTRCAVIMGLNDTTMNRISLFYRVSLLDCHVYFVIICDNAGIQNS